MRNQESEIITVILKKLSHKKQKWCVEFGAWDGVAGSNTRDLILNQDFQGIFIEGDHAKYVTLVKNYNQNPKVICINRYVNINTADKNSLDKILAETPIPSKFDFLSIDVDGNDYHIWESLIDYRPKLVCIEINPTIPVGVEYVQKKDPKTFHGSSLTSMEKLAQQKRYCLVASTEINAFFVKKGLVKKLNNYSFPKFKGSKVTNLFAGLDGTVILSGYKKHPGHEIPYPENKFQIIPKSLICLPGYHQGWKKAFFAIWLFIFQFNKFKRALTKRVGKKN